MAMVARRRMVELAQFRLATHCPDIVHILLLAIRFSWSFCSRRSVVIRPLQICERASFQLYGKVRDPDKVASRNCVRDNSVRSSPHPCGISRHRLAPGAWRLDRRPGSNRKTPNSFREEDRSPC